MLWAAPAPGMTGATAIVAEILVARHLKTTEDLFDKRWSTRTESMVAAAVHELSVIQPFGELHLLLIIQCHG